MPTVSFNYILTCNVNIPSTLMIVSYSWMEGNTLLTGQNTSQLDLSPLQLTQNTTQYICHYSATSAYLVNPVMGMSLPHEILIIGKYNRMVWMMYRLSENIRKIFVKLFVIVYKQPDSISKGIYRRGKGVKLNFPLGKSNSQLVHISVYS